MGALKLDDVPGNDVLRGRRREGETEERCMQLEFRFERERERERDVKVSEEGFNGFG